MSIFSLSVSTCKRWLHAMGFEVITPLDGHERPDVVDDRKKFLNSLILLIC